MLRPTFACLVSLVSAKEAIAHNDSLALDLGGLPHQHSTAPVTIPFTTLSRGEWSGFTGKLATSFDNKGDFAKFWAIHSRPPHQVPDVDFGRERVTAIFWGSKASTGFNLNVTSVEMTDPSGPEVAVSYDLSLPVGGGVFRAITQPHQIIKFKLVERVKFNPNYLAIPFHFSISMGGADEASVLQVAEKINKLEGASNMFGRGPVFVYYISEIGSRGIEGEIDSTLYTEDQARDLLENASTGGIVYLSGGDTCHEDAGDVKI